MAPERRANVTDVTGAAEPKLVQIVFGLSIRLGSFAESAKSAR